ncbi:hypothetical protein [Shewanella youngdeokensis]|uniref:Uncharacterized protein n=1 Tax=Shewanella youngdeokensis TaxID=2999068 RepID=A0ABZ0JXY4_9GAMM|nr:hypothetical protein RGE70_14240 [Shewanella sp. DAU334]
MHTSFRVSALLTVVCLLYLSFSTTATTPAQLTQVKVAPVVAPTAETTIKLSQYLGGSETKLAQQPALVFMFGNGTESNTCSITTTDSYLRHSNYRLENINLSESNFYFDCYWNGTYYFLSKRQPTYAEVLIKHPDSQFPMSMHIEAKLISLTGERMNIISGDISLRR